MKTLLKTTINLSFGILSFLFETIQSWVIKNKLVEKGEKEREKFQGFAGEKYQKVFRKLNIPNRADFQRLEKRIQDLENQRL
jgi:hypothetical protein